MEQLNYISVVKMVITRSLVFFVLLSLFPNLLMGQNTSQMETKVEEWEEDVLPKRDSTLAIVLSGGGAKGIAQVGVLRMLEEEGIRPDLITGTSIGSILGGLYAIGYSIEDLEELANSLDWAYYFDDEIERRYFPIYERMTAERYQLRFSFDKGKISLPKGVVRGKKIALLLSRLTIPAHNIHNFNDFEIPYRGIATDFETGEAIAFEEGDLADVMRASMSIPSVFVPFEIGDKIFIDGGVTRNLPVEDAIYMDADKIIAIDIGAPLYNRDNLGSMLDVLDQTSSFRIVESNNEQATLADVVIKPEIADISALSFDQNDRLMFRGKKATEKMMPEIKKLVTGKTDLPPRGVTLPEEIEVTYFEIEGGTEKELKTIRKLLQIKECKIYTLDEIENRIKELYGSELVALASYRIIPADGGYLLKVKVQTQPGDFVRMSANYDSRLKAGLLLNLTLRNRLFSGSKFNVDLKISENPSLDIDYFVHTSGRPNIAWQLGARGRFYPGLTYIDGEKENLFDIRHFQTEANIFSTFNNRFLISTGIGLERFVRSEEFFDPNKEDTRFNQAFLQFRFLRDTYDREHFPRSGSFVQLDGQYSFQRSLKSEGSDTIVAIPNNNAKIRFHAVKAFPISSKLTSVIGLNAAYTQKVENNYLNRYYLGRAMTGELSHIEFAGLRYMEQPVSAFAAARLKLQVEPVADFFTSLVFNSAFYNLENYEIIDGLVTGNVIKEEETIYGIGLELGMLTRLGPAVFSAEYNFLYNRPNFFLHIGHAF